eukprot:COSAG02_NODE_482_length_21409_cov_126.131018_7_plen_118_part_00
MITLFGSSLDEKHAMTSLVASAMAGTFQPRALSHSKRSAELVEPISHADIAIRTNHATIKARRRPSTGSKPEPATSCDYGCFVSCRYGPKALRDHAPQPVELATSKMMSGWVRDSSC